MLSSSSSRMRVLLVIVCIILACIANTTAQRRDARASATRGIPVGVPGSNSGGAGGSTCEFYRCTDPTKRALPRPGYKAESNGCGSYGFKLASKWHEPCCDVHDKCYGKCGASRDVCDMEFKGCMTRKCNALSDKSQKRDCNDQATMFYTGTQALGCSAFQQSQVEACLCINKDQEPGTSQLSSEESKDNIKQQVQKEKRKANTQKATKLKEEL